MLAQITLQAAFLPMMLALISVFAWFRSSVIQKHFIHVLLVSWLIVYTWIVRLPDIPPKQATDYLWLIVLSFVAINMFLEGNKIRSIIQSIAFVVFSILMLWAVLTYDASWASHWLICLEFLVLSTLVLLQSFVPREYEGRIKGFLMASVLGVSSLLIIASGSLLLGLIAASLASIVAIPSFFSGLKMDQIAIESFQLLALSILVIARFYAGLSIFVFALIVASFVAVRFLSFTRVLHFVVPLVFVLAAVAVVINEEIGAQANYY